MLPLSGSLLPDADGVSAHRDRDELDRCLSDRGDAARLCDGYLPYPPGSALLCVLRRRHRAACPRLRHSGGLLAGAVVDVPEEDLPADLRRAGHSQPLIGVKITPRLFHIGHEKMSDAFEFHT